MSVATARAGSISWQHRARHGAAMWSSLRHRRRHRSASGPKVWAMLNFFEEGVGRDSTAAERSVQQDKVRHAEAAVELALSFDVAPV